LKDKLLSLLFINSKVLHSRLNNSFRAEVGGAKGQARCAVHDDQPDPVLVAVIEAPFCGVVASAAIIARASSDCLAQRQQQWTDILEHIKPGLHEFVRLTLTLHLVFVLR